MFVLNESAAQLAFRGLSIMFFLLFLVNNIKHICDEDRFRKIELEYKIIRTERKTQLIYTVCLSFLFSLPNEVNEPMLNCFSESASMHQNPKGDKYNQVRLINNKLRRRAKEKMNLLHERISKALRDSIRLIVNLKLNSR